MAVCTVTWSSDESMLITAGWEDNTARAWHIPSGLPAQALAPLRRAVCAVEWVVGHWLCAGGGGDEVIVLWRIEPRGTAGSAGGVGGMARDPVARLATGGRSVVSLSCSPDGKRLVALLSGQCLRVFDLERITKELEQEGRDQVAHPASYVGPGRAEDGSHMMPRGLASAHLEADEAGGAETDAMDVLEERGATRADAAPPPPPGRQDSRLLDGNIKAVRGDGSLVMADAIEERDAKARAYLASAPYQHVRVFECVLEVQEPVAGMSFVTSVLVAGPPPRDRIMLSCVSMYGEPILVEWDLGRLKIVQSFRGHRMERFVTGVTAGGPGEALVCAGSEDGSVMLWHRQSGRPVKRLAGHQGAVNSLSWCLLDASPGRLPDGEADEEGEPSYLFASASDDRKVRVWRPLPRAHSSSTVRDGVSDVREGQHPECPGAFPVAPNRKLGRKDAGTDTFTGCNSI